MSGHFYNAEMLLDKGETYTNNESYNHACKGNKPSLQGEDISYCLVFRTEAAEDLYVFTLFNDEHGQTAEYIEGDDDDGEE